MQAQRQKFGTLILQTAAWVILPDAAKKRVVKTISKALAELRHNTVRARRPEPCAKS